MNLSKIFNIREEVTPNIITLLENTTLGSNGARYKHLDTAKRIYEADSPLFLTIEKQNKVLGNITFCRRENTWYIRYFAFASFLQTSTNKKPQEKTNSWIKKELHNFFNEVFENSNNSPNVKAMYAYIDPRNDRSKWMSEQFGFNKTGELVTQSFSRINPKRSERLGVTENWDFIQPLVEKNYGDHQYYFTTHAQKPPFYFIKNDEGEIIACAKVTTVNWEIQRLPGKTGGILVKTIPYIPFLRKLIKPQKHTFLVPELVCYPLDQTQIVEELFSAILAEYGLNVLFWWIDKNDPVYHHAKDKIRWGILHQLVGVPAVDIMERKKTETNVSNRNPFFVTAFDMV